MVSKSMVHLPINLQCLNEISNVRKFGEYRTCIIIQY